MLNVEFWMLNGGRRLVGQRLTHVAPPCNKVLDLQIDYRCMPAFYAQDLVTIVQVEVDPEVGEM